MTVIFKLKNDPDFIEYVKAVDSELKKSLGAGILKILSWLKKKDLYRYQYPCNKKLFKWRYTFYARLLNGKPVRIVKEGFFLRKVYVSVYSTGILPAYTVFTFLDDLRFNFTATENTIKDILND